MLDGKYNDKCDLWSIGVIIFILVTGRTPFGGGEDDEILENVANPYYPIDFSEFIRLRGSVSGRGAGN